MNSDPMFKKSVSFEWVIEHVDEHDDIQDHDHASKLSESGFKEVLNAILSGSNFHEGLSPRLALIRDYGSEAESLIGRSYAYAYKSENGCWVMPDETDMGNKVPDRFKKQLQVAQKKQQGENNA